MGKNIGVKVSEAGMKSANIPGQEAKALTGHEEAGIAQEMGVTAGHALPSTLRGQRTGPIGPGGWPPAAMEQHERKEKAPWSDDAGRLHPQKRQTPQLARRQGRPSSGP